MQLKFPKQNLYEIIGLKNFASIEDIHKRYRMLALKHHPDRGGKLEDMQMLNNIYDIFKDHKEKYDIFLQRLLNPRPVMVFRYTFNGNYGDSTASTSGGWF